MKAVPIVALVVLFLTASCASQLPETRQYLLRTSGPAFAGDPAAKPVAVLGNVTVASYVDRRGLVLETEDGVFQAARHHMWAEPLRESLRSFLADEIGRQAGAPIRARNYGGTSDEGGVDRRIDIRIDQLHGERNGEALLVAHWALIDTTERSVVSEHSFSERESLGYDGYAALVEAESRLLHQLAESIAATLR